jgi:uncharacterized protein YndB with AHSA1/START domain
MKVAAGESQYRPEVCNNYAYRNTLFRHALHMKLKICALLITVILTRSNGADAAESQLVDGFINAPLSEVWRIFTTTEGYKSTGVKQADTDLRIGGHIRMQYGAGEPSDATIDGEILAFDPEHMLALRVAPVTTNLPRDAAASNPWTVTYFDSAGGNMTRVRVVAVGFTADPASQALRALLEKANRDVLARVAKPYWPKCAHCQLESPLAPQQ